MSAFFERTFRIHPDETRIVLSLGFVILVNSLALSVSDVVAISGFLNEVDAPSILIIWLIDMVLILLMTGLQSLLVDRIDRRKLMSGMALVIMAAYIVLRLMFSIVIIPPSLNYSLLYLLAEQQWLFFPLVFWVLANDIFDIAQAKRIFPFIASFSFIGQILGLALGAIAPGLLHLLGLDTPELLTLNVLLLLIAYLVLNNTLQKVHIRETTYRTESIFETLSEGIGFVQEVPSFRFMTIGLLTMAIGFIILEFNFLFISDATPALADQDAFQRFYGLFYLVVTVIAFFIQSLLTSRLIERFSLKNIFLFMPFMLLLVMAGVLAAPALIGSTIGLALMYLSKDTIDEPAHKAFQSLVPEERRGRVSLFMDSILFASGTILGCLVTGAIILLFGTEGNLVPAYLILGIGCALIAIWANFKTRETYDSSLLNWRLKRRTRGAKVLDNLDF